MKTPTLAEIKAANREFFSRENNEFFGTHKWTKNGRVIESVGKRGIVFCRYVDYESLKLDFITEKGNRWFLSRWDDTKGVTGYQEIDSRGEFVGEEIPLKEFQEIQS